MKPPGEWVAAAALLGIVVIVSTWLNQGDAMTVPTGSYGDGRYAVGADLTPGTYRTPGGACYWVRDQDGWGGFPNEWDDAPDADAVASGFVDRPTRITVRGTDGHVRFQGGCVWTPDT